MKKLTITIALILIVALAMPAFGQSFSDVPSDHWAYDAINKLVAAGIVEGYPDGEFKGSQNMTRYEMAVMVSRALDQIADAREDLVDKVDEMGEGLTTGQAEDVTAIVKSLMEKNTDKTLSDQEAKEVADIVDALTFELAAELKVLGADVDAVESDLAEVQETVAKLKADMPQDNIEFGATIDTFAEVANYGDNPAAVIELWADGDALDITAPTTTDEEDAEDFPAEKKFWQEIGIDATGELNGASFNLAVDTTTNVFTEEDTVFDSSVYTVEEDGLSLAVDSALLEVAYNDYGVKLGDLDGYTASSYFVDDEDMEGMEMTASYMGNDITAFILGEDYDVDTDYYGVHVSREMDFGTVTGKVYQASFDLETKDVTDVAVEVTDVAVTDMITVGGEVVFNDTETESDTLFNVNAEAKISDALTVDGMFETVGENFESASVLGDLEEANNYDKFNVGASYVVNENNTVTGDYTLVQSDAAGNNEDKSTVEVALDNTYGKFTNNASVAYTMNDGYTDGHDTTVIELGTEYAWNETTTLGAALVNKNEEKAAGNVISYNYLKGTMDKELAENMSWNTELKYITGEVGTANTEGTGNALTTSLSVSF
ncbi:S-layer family protein [Halanaerobium saccharolyticum]|uniref:S-layer family protein n=1 Tax=Halanaerobium saccharolyticum TaxID=43595 RepID=A0A4R6M1R1_9FIRM|nr:S-layer homology domain-containing protein [Halanaerobium saccharolyticum]TDO95113.1 S-layer family protein [Halanaerobium saccharolyticum]